MRAYQVAMVTMLILLSSGMETRATVTIDWVPVGDAGNTGELTGEGTGPGGWGPVHMVGSVGYDYYIGKYEVTNGQYIQFLNAVAVTDSYGLYNPGMSGTYGGIERTGTQGTYSYGPKGGDAAWLNRPVTQVHWYDAVRFANWMHNGQPTGVQNDLTTEDGAYDLSLGITALRKPGAQIFLPSETEWYKAAYYKGGGLDAGYWDYATRHDETPNNNAPTGDTGNSSNHYALDYAVGAPYYSTEVGAYASSYGAYGTYDQSGNVREWTETRVGGDIFIRGGSMHGTAGPAADAHWNNPEHPSYYYADVGFRLATLVPEPSTVLLLVAGSVLLCNRRHRLMVR